MKPIRLGIFGGSARGRSFFETIQMNGGQIVAMCDFNREHLENAKKVLGEDVGVYENFDEFLEHEGMEAVLLSNFFHEHAPYAIRCLEKGIHVLSECVSNSTMAEGVALVRAAEKSGAIYMLAENYPYMKFNQEMRRVYDGGTLGRVMYAEGEYNHPGKAGDYNSVRVYRPFEKHWRHFLPATYYITHSLAPLMYITGARPTRVTAFPVWGPPSDAAATASHVGDAFAAIACLNDNDSVFRVFGCSKFGGHGNSYRICGQKGQIENVRGTDGKIMLRYNEWDVPEGCEATNFYMPDWPEGTAELAEKTSHDGGDFYVFYHFFQAIRTGVQPEFDVYFATTTASVAILAHRSVLSGGQPFDVPDFHKEEERVKYENDHDTPFWGTDGSEPTMPCCSRPDYRPSEAQLKNYYEALQQVQHYPY